MVTLIKIEPSHNHIDSTDSCYYLMEYHAGKGYEHSNENSLIYNFKKHPTDKGQYYKLQAIGKVTELLCTIFNNKYTSDYIFIPIPPSKSKTDPEYDNRLVQVLESIKKEIGIPYYDILDRQISSPSLHSGIGSRNPDNHKILFNCEDLSIFKNKTIILFDDVITTGSTYKATKKVLMSNLKDFKKIVGLFIAKSI